MIEDCISVLPGSWRDYFYENVSRIDSRELASELLSNYVCILESKLKELNPKIDFCEIAGEPRVD